MESPFAHVVGERQGALTRRKWEVRLLQRPQKESQVGVLPGPPLTRARLSMHKAN
jgi:hypothetical protein